MSHRLSLCSLIREGGRVLGKLVSARGEWAEQPLASLLPTALWPAYLGCSWIEAHQDMEQRHRHDSKTLEAYVLCVELQEDVQKAVSNLYWIAQCIPLQSSGHRATSYLTLLLQQVT